MTKFDENRLQSQRIEALIHDDPHMTIAKAETLIWRWKRGRSAPSVKQVERVLKKAGLNDRSA